MRWFDLRCVAIGVFVLASCSDDGVPGDAETDGNATATASAGSTGGGDPTSPSSAVTTANPSGTGPDSASTTTDPTDATDPSGITDSGSSTSPTTSDDSGSSTGNDGSTGSSSTGGSSIPECMVADDCVLVDDCCTCDAIPEGEEPPKCDLGMTCLIPTCQSQGHGNPDVECNFGVCEVADVNCDPQTVLCDEEPPECPPDQAPRVVDGCWMGCIAVEHCNYVRTCDACLEDEVCVEEQAGFKLGPRLRCEPIGYLCEGEASCDCMEDVCDPDAGFSLCEDDQAGPSGAGITCQCPAC